MAYRYRVVIARQAKRDLQAVGPPDRGRLTMNLVSLSAGEPVAGLVAVRSCRYLAACEVLARRRLVVVYAVVERRGLRSELIGVG